MADLQNGLYGIINGATFLGSAECTDAMKGCIKYGFQCYDYKEAYLPSNTIKLVISGEKLQENASKFYAYAYS